MRNADLRFCFKKLQLKFFAFFISVDNATLTWYYIRELRDTLCTDRICEIEIKGACG